MNQIFIVGRLARCKHDKTPLQPGEPTWAIGGVYTTAKEAEALCTDCRCFVVPWQLNKFSRMAPGRFRDSTRLAVSMLCSPAHDTQ